MKGDAVAIFNTARLLDVIVRGRIAEPAPAAELVNELEEQVSQALSNYPTQDRMDLMEQRIMLAIAELKQHQSETEARLTKHITQAVGILLAGTALAVGIILGFG